jgi:hypothetical protein
MASISDKIDRFTRNTRNIKVAASKTVNPATTLPIFTRAVLHTNLGDLITDIDPSDLSLFTLEQTNSDPQLARTQFSGATPLKRQPARQDPPQETEPEVFARAALKYIDQ